VDVDVNRKVEAELNRRMDQRLDLDGGHSEAAYLLGGWPVTELAGCDRWPSGWAGSRSSETIFDHAIKRQRRLVLVSLSLGLTHRANGGRGTRR
jgi:hypothetical protein